MKKPSIPSAKILVNQVSRLKETAQMVRDEFDDKTTWLEGKSDSYRESDQGLQWDEYLTGLEIMLDDIDNLTDELP